MSVTLYAEHPESGRREWGTYPSLAEARTAVEAADDAAFEWEQGDHALQEPPAEAWPEGFDAVAYGQHGAVWVLIDDWYPASFLLAEGDPRGKGEPSYTVPDCFPPGWPE